MDLLMERDYLPGKCELRVTTPYIRFPFFTFSIIF